MLFICKLSLDIRFIFGGIYNLVLTYIIVQERKPFTTTKSIGSFENVHTKLLANAGDTSGRDLNLTNIKRIGLYSALELVFCFPLLFLCFVV